MQTYRQKLDDERTNDDDDDDDDGKNKGLSTCELYAELRSAIIYEYYIGGKPGKKCISANKRRM